MRTAQRAYSKYIVLLSIASFVALIDQVLKILVQRHFQLHESIEVISGFFNLTYVRNPGAAFGFLAASHPTFRELFFLIMPPVALIIIFAILRKTDERHKATIVSLSLIFGGALGNYIDRLKFRYVVDFLDFHIQRSVTWPAFNTADIAIVCGVATLLFLEFNSSSYSTRANHQ